ncbi:MAG: hypothetical protein WC197_09090 [Candidatus Gastranaerophilaceae bacterium]|jgi:hypothetical protein
MNIDVNEPFDLLYKKYNQKLNQLENQTSWKKVFPSKLLAHLFLDKTAPLLYSEKTNRLFWGSPTIHGKTVKNSLIKAQNSELITEDQKNALQKLDSKYDQYLQKATIVDGMRYSRVFWNYIKGQRGITLLLSKLSFGKQVNSKEVTTLASKVAEDIKNLPVGDSLILPAGNKVHAALLYVVRESESQVKIYYVDQAGMHEEDGRKDSVQCFEGKNETFIDAKSWENFYKKLATTTESNVDFFKKNFDCSKEPLSLNLRSAVSKALQKSNSCSMVSHQGLIRLALVLASPDEGDGVNLYKIFKTQLREAAYSEEGQNENVDLKLKDLSLLKNRITKRYEDWIKKGIPFEEGKNKFIEEVKLYQDARREGNDIMDVPDYVVAAVEEKEVLESMLKEEFKNILEQKKQKNLISSCLIFFNKIIMNKENRHALDYVPTGLLLSAQSLFSPDDYLNTLEQLLASQIQVMNTDWLIISFDKIIFHIENKAVRDQLADRHNTIINKFFPERRSNNEYKKLIYNHLENTPSKQWILLNYSNEIKNKEQSKIAKGSGWLFSALNNNPKELLEILKNDNYADLDLSYWLIKISKILIKNPSEFDKWSEIIEKLLEKDLDFERIPKKKFTILEKSKLEEILNKCEGSQSRLIGYFEKILKRQEILWNNHPASLKKIQESLFYLNSVGES